MSLISRKINKTVKKSKLKINYVVLCNVKLKRLTTSPRSGTSKATSVANACSPAHCLAEDIISLQTEELRRIQNGSIVP